MDARASRGGIAGAGLALAVACAMMPPVTVTSAGGDRRVELQRGQELVVALDANPTTGYRWEIVGGAPAALEPLGEGQYVPAPVPGGRVGGGGTMTWRFRAVRPGSGALRLEYRRPWEKDGPPARTFNCAVEIH